MNNNSNSGSSHMARGEVGEIMNDALIEPLEAEQLAPALLNDLDQYRIRPTRITHLDIVRVVERLHRRSLDLIKADLIKQGVDDLSPSQVMVLFTIGSSEMSVRELIDRGYYLGSNTSYSLKRLVEAGYVIRTASERDRRSARIRLSDKGIELCNMIKELDRGYHRLVTRDVGEIRDLETTFRTLNRLEQVWSSAARYGGEPIGD